MNKKKALLLVTITSMVTISGTIILANNRFDDSGVFAINKSTVNEDYTLVLDSHNKLASDDTVLTSSGNKIQFAYEGNVTKTSIGFFEFGNNEISSSIYNTSAIKGMKSISFTMDYSQIYLHFGYKEDDTIHYTNYCELNGVDQGEGIYSFSREFKEVPPSYFKLECFGNNKIIDNVNIEYSCSESGFVPTELSSFSGFTYIEAEDAYKVEGLVANRKKMQTLVVPATYNNKPVVEIASQAFWTNWDIEYVIIEEGIKRIGAQAFYLDASLKYIVLPSTIESVGDKAFEGCAGLKSQTIPAATTSISLSAYAGNQFLEEIIVEEGNPNYYSNDGMLYEKSTDKLLICPAGKIESVKDSGIISIPNSCKAIGDLAFKNSKATTISIGSGVTSIDETFKSCSSLTAFVVDSNNNYYSAPSGILCNSLGGVLYAYPRGNTSDAIYMPTKVRLISDGAFSGANHLKTINFMDTTHIGKEAFTNMAKLESVGLTNVSEIGEGAFKNNPKLKTIALGTNLHVIPVEAFMNCPSLVSISLPYSITDINAGAFKDCPSLDSVTFPPQHLVTVGNEVFMNCTSLDVDDLEIPDSISSMGVDVFRNTASTSIAVPTAMKYIPDGMFRDCDSLVSITIPLHVETIGYDAFRDCDNLTGVTILDNTVTTILSRAFYRANITEIFIPKCVDVIEGSALACGKTLHIYTDQKTPSGYGDEYSSSSLGGGYLKPGWSEGLSGDQFYIHYNRSRS